MTSTNESEPETTPDTLNGWKDIAAYLGKSVRSVQRWEQQFGLPVHRINTPNGQIIYSSRQEVDAWRVRMDDASDGAVETPPSTPVVVNPAEPTPPAPEPKAITRRPRLSWLILGAAIVAFVLALAIPRILSAEGPTQFVLIGRNLEARDHSGRLVWAHPFDSEVRSNGSGHTQGTSRLRDAAAHIDLNGDGHMAAIVPIRWGGFQESPSKTDGLYAFADDGRVLWSVTEVPSWTCDGVQFTGPWAISDVLVSEGPGPKRVWVSYRHDWSWQSFVIEIRPDGVQRLVYLQTGWIETLAEWVVPAGRRLAAGGVLNGPDMPSVALIDPDAPASMSPHDKPEYRCVGAPVVGPSRVTVLPNFEMAKANGDPYIMAQRLSVAGSDLKVDMDGGSVMARLGPDEQVKALMPTDMYWVLHRKLEGLRLLAHPADECPERTVPHEVRTWTPTGTWQTYKVDPAKR